MKKAMIITVGTGRNREDIAEAIFSSIEERNPDYVHFLTSPISEEQTLPILKLKLQNAKKMKYTSRNIEEVNHVEVLRKIYTEEIKKIKNLGYRADQIEADYTSGTKPMSAALVLAAANEKLRSLLYTGGERDYEGRVTGEKRDYFSVTPPVTYMHYKDDLKDAKSFFIVNLFNQYKFQSCISILEVLEELIEDNVEISKVSFLKRLVLGYLYWDNLNLKKALQYLREISRNAVLVEKYEIKDQLVRNIDFLSKELDSPLNIERLLDLMESSRRKSKDGRISEAITLMYCVLELMIHMRLNIEFGYDPLRIKNRTLPLQIQEKYPQDLLDKGLSTNESLQLLGDINDRMGISLLKDYTKFESNIKRSFMRCLNIENAPDKCNILNPLLNKEYTMLRNVIEKYLDKYFSGWDSRASDCEFPVLSIENIEYKFRELNKSIFRIILDRIRLLWIRSRQSSRRLIITIIIYLVQLAIGSSLFIAGLIPETGLSFTLFGILQGLIISVIIYILSRK